MFTHLKTPIKSELDKRSYRCGVLANKLKVLLVRDADSDHAGASLNVAVGHLNDPDGLLGLSHFVEHLVFLGTEKYPEEGQYEQYLKSHGGFDNATTGASSTEYYFSVSIPKSSRSSPSESPLPQALDYLAQFFISPLFKESALERELKAVHNEFESGLQSDSRRIHEVQKEMFNPKHPASRFANGNNKSLRGIPKTRGLVVRDECVAHHEKYYSANLMTLAVVSPHTLDEMQEWVVRFFSLIENKDRPHPAREYDKIPLYNGAQRGKKLSIATVMNRRTLMLQWVLPEHRSHYRSKPWSVVEDLIGHEWDGGLFGALKEDGQIDSLFAAYTGSFLGSEQDQEGFMVSIELTQAGLEDVYGVVSAVFSFIEHCRKVLPGWYYNELALMRNLGFKYNCEPGNSLGIARSLSNSLQREYIATEDILRGGYMMNHYDEPEALDILDKLTADDVTITVAGQSLKDPMNSIEPWYGTRYGIEDISAEVLSSFRDQNPMTYKFEIPKRNPYLPEKLDIIGKKVPEGEQDLSHPEGIDSRAGLKLLHKTDRQFQRPYISVDMDFKTPLTSSSARNALLSSLYVKLVFDSLSEVAYVAGEAGLSYGIHTTQTGFQLEFFGYSDQLLGLIEKVLRRIAEFKADPARFLVILDQEQRSYKNFHKMTSSDIAASRATTLLSIPVWSNEECQACFSSGVLTAEAVDEFSSTVLRELQAKVFVYGNATEEWTRGLGNTVREVLNFAALDESQVPKTRLVQIPTEFEVLFRQQCPNAEEKNSATRLIYQVGPAAEMKTWVALVLLADILSDPFFKELRTNQQLGYGVEVWNSTRKGIACLEIEVSGTEKSPESVCLAVEEYLRDFRATKLASLTASELAPHVKSYVSRVSEPDLTCYSRAARLWGEIHSGYLMFDRNVKLSKVAESMSVVEIVALFDGFIATKAPNRRRFLSLVYGNVHNVPKDAELVAAIQKASGGRKVRLVKENAIHAFRGSMDLWRVGEYLDPFVTVSDS